MPDFNQQEPNQSDSSKTGSELQEEQPQELHESNQIAAIDLGSNSFHMLIAQQLQGELRTVEKRGEKVQLAAGLNERGYLSEEAMQRGLECLRGFAKHLRNFKPEAVTIVATNALRVARNRSDFITRAEEILGFQIELIAGREEARLIYLGVSHTQADDEGKRLVIDIGGGSTEFIIGERFESKALESLFMGCVSYTQQFFPDGKVTDLNFHRAVARARRELLEIQQAYKAIGWSEVIGSSGTIRATEQVLIKQGWSEQGITREGLNKLCQWLTSHKNVADIELPGFKPQRKQVFIAGVAILKGIFDTFKIKTMHYSDGALREGALWDLIGRSGHEDVRQRTVNSMQQRFHIDLAQASRVKNCAQMMLQQVEKDWKLPSMAKNWLLWAAELHEVGLSITHHQFQKHGAYLVQHSDMAGFTRQGQELLSVLLKGHRRKFPVTGLESLNPMVRQQTRYVCMLLRLAAVLNHSRGSVELPVIECQAKNASITLIFPKGWFEQHPLTYDDLTVESNYLNAAGLELVVAEET
jgi:exopolyphosphatase/guanosine-5'-triphosphate,3'-diphosphate pyrophosphatase